MAGIKNYTAVVMESIVAIIMLVAVALPIINGMPEVTGTYASTINTLIGIIPVLLAVAVIIGIVYMTILNKKD